MSRGIDANYPDVQLVRHNLGGIHYDRDAVEYPWVLRLKMRVPELGQVAWALMFGTEEVVVEGKSREALERLAEGAQWRSHPRFLSLEILEDREGVHA